MFDPEELPEIAEKLNEFAALDKPMLDSLCDEVKLFKPYVKVIKPRSITTFSLVATEGTSNKLVYNPFYFQLIRIVDSNGQNLCLDIITPNTNTDYLSEKQFDELGNPQTALGVLMKDLDCKTLNDLSSMIPKGEDMIKHPSKVSNSWVLTYRDLCEWAVIYDKICYHDFTNDTVIIKDGLLRSKIFQYDTGKKKAMFIEMMNRIQASIEKYRKRKIKIYLVGLAKHNQVINRYSLALQLENILPAGEPRYAKVPKEIEEKSYIWKEYINKDTSDDTGEINKMSVGSLYLVRFGKSSMDPVWAIDLLASQTSHESEIMGYLLMDTIDGFPIPHYPICLQKALEFSQVVDFDLEILQDHVVEAVRSLLPRDKYEIIDAKGLASQFIYNRV